jgi:hypothetical protein
LGTFAPARRVPLSVSVSVAGESTNTARITVDAVSAEGWYAVEIKSLTSRIYAKAFDRLFTRLRESAPPS